MNKLYWEIRNKENGKYFILNNMYFSNYYHDFRKDPDIGDLDRNLITILEYL